MFHRRLHIRGRFIIMKEIYRLDLHMRKVLTKFIIPQTLLANWGSYITHTSKYNKGRFIFDEAKGFKELSQSKVRKCKADDRITEEDNW